MRIRNLAVLAVLVAVAGAAFALWFTGRETLDAVDIDRAREDVAAAPAAPSEPGSGVEEAVGEVAGELVDPSGTWRVDVDAVPFDAVARSGTFVGYRIDEVLQGVGDFTAVGRSPEVEGTVVIADGSVVQAEVRAGLAALTSDDARRDGRVRSLFADRPAVFTLTAPVPFDWTPEGRERVEVDAPGTLRVGAAEQDVTMRLVAEVVGGRLLVTGSTVVTLADLDVRVPSAPIVLSVSDEATIELQLVLARG